MRHGWTYWMFLISITAFASNEPSPQQPPDNVYLEKQALRISYNTRHKQADWVFYSLGKSELKNCVQRANNFRKDPALPDSISADLSDYSKSGYDRGHLSPAGDNKWSISAMNDSFLLSNISPQPPKFNQHIWAQLENLVRAWAIQYQGLWIATGPELSNVSKTIGRNEVSIPDFFYKVIITKVGKRTQGIGFRLPTNANQSLENYATTIDDIQMNTHLDFFSGINNENDIETTYDPNFWDFNAKFNSIPCNTSDSQILSLPDILFSHSLRQFRNQFF